MGNFELCSVDHTYDSINRNFFKLLILKGTPFLNRKLTPNRVGGQELMKKRNLPLMAEVLGGVAFIAVSVPQTVQYSFNVWDREAGSLCFLGLNFKVFGFNKADGERRANGGKQVFFAFDDRWTSPTIIWKVGGSGSTAEAWTEEDGGLF